MLWFYFAWKSVNKYNSKAWQIGEGQDEKRNLILPYKILSKNYPPQIPQIYFKIFKNRRVRMRNTLSFYFAWQSVNKNLSFSNPTNIFQNLEKTVRAGTRNMFLFYFAWQSVNKALSSSNPTDDIFNTTITCTF